MAWMGIQGSSYRHHWGLDTDSSAMPGTGSPMNVFVDMMVLLAFPALCRKNVALSNLDNGRYAQDIALSTESEVVLVT